MKTPFRELWLHWGLVELVKAPQRLREGSTNTPRRLREATVVAMLRDGVMGRSRGLRGASVVARGAAMAASLSLHSTLAPPIIRHIMTGHDINAQGFFLFDDTSDYRYNVIKPNEAGRLCAEGIVVR